MTAQAPPLAPKVQRRFTDRISQTLSVWRHSLQFRVLSILAIIATISILATTSFGLWQVRDQIFEDRVNSIVDEFGANARAASAQFSSVAASNPGEVQSTANTVVFNLYDPTSSVVGAMMMRSPNQPDGGFAILEPSNTPSVQIRGLVTDEIRDAVVGSTDLHWQSVAVPMPSGDVVPGIVIGAPITVPGSGEYELYAIYSLGDENRTVTLVTTVQIIAGLVLLTFLLGMALVIVRMLLLPIKEASRSASKIADGAFEVRMTVRGEDEIAQLARSFNAMASSLDEQFTRLQRLSKVQQDFVSAVSHELRSPVTTIRMAGQIMYDKRDELPPALKRSTELMQRQLVNLDHMLADLLEISRFDAGSMALNTDLTDIAEIARNVVDMTAPLSADNDVTVVVETSGDTYAQVEARRIERIIRNLVVNAVEHADGTAVWVQTAGNETAVAVRVIDHGIGMTQEAADHVFDRFWRADSARVRKTGGTGLGLTIAREDAVLHGGEIQVWGVEGEGSSFLLIVPREPGTPYVSPLDVEVDLTPVPGVDAPPIEFEEV